MHISDLSGRGWTLADIGRKLNVTRSCVSYWKTNKNGAIPKKYHRAARRMLRASERKN